MHAIGAATAAVLVVDGYFAPRQAAAGWLIAYATVGAVPLGALALLFIHALTGGRWGKTAGPALSVAAAAMPALIVFFLAVLLCARVIYPWVITPSAAGPGVAALYLNPASFGLRGFVFLTGLALLATLRAHRPLGRLAAGLGLVWYAVGMDLLAVDWLLSLEPRYTSSAFGAQIIVAQLSAALAFAILTADASADDKAWNDLGSLLLATTLGETYLILMTFIVHWYGDLPDQAEWYLRRTEHAWAWLAVVGVLLGAIGPLIALLFTGVRAARIPLRRVAIASLIGVAIEMTWLIAPVAGGGSALIGVLATIAAGSLTLAVGDGLDDLAKRRRRVGV